MTSIEHDRAETLLRESETLLRRARHVAKPGHWVSTVMMQPDGSVKVVTQYGSAAAEILGRSLAELEISDEDFIGSFIHPDDRAECYLLNEKYVSDLVHLPVENAKPVYYNCSYRIIRADGEVRNINEMVESAITPDGSLRYLMGTIQDVTEQKTVETALAESRVLLRQIIDTIPATISVRDLQGRYVFANDALAKFHGRTVDWFPGRSLDELYDAIYVRQVLEVDRQIINTGQKQAFHRLEHHHADGRIGTWFTLRTPIHDAAGRIQYVMSVALDVTEAKQLEGALQESEKRFRSIADSIPALIWMTDKTSQCIFLNKQWSDFTGRPAAEELGHGYLESIHPEDRAASIEAEHEMMASRGHMTDEYRLRRRDGIYRWFLDTMVPRFSAHGDYLGHMGILIDIDDRRALEEKLRQVQRLEVIGNLAGGIAHDFNNLLTVVIGNLDLIGVNPQDVDRVTRLSATALQAAERGAALVHRMVAFSRQQTLNPRRIELNELVTRASQMLRHSLEKSIEIELKLAPDLGTAIADAGQLEDSMLNLALNARDAMPNGGRLTIETANSTFGPNGSPNDAELKPGDYVMLTVSDTGTGMTPEVLAQAVQPFFTTKEVGKGSGLGLSMVYGFVKQSGGHLEIDSEIGKGCRIKIYLPRDANTAEQPAKPIAQKAVGGHETILVVEDDEMVRNFVVEQLRNHGYSILEAKDGAEALALIGAGKRIDLLFTDVMLPGGTSGPQLLEQIRHDQPALRALFTSGYSQDHVLVRERGADAVRLLQKPYSRQQLAVEIRAALDSKPATA
jgi:PAS domain S-box-containing protein